MKVRVEKLVYGGDGLAYAIGPPEQSRGKPVFVPFVLPGEVVEVFPIQETRKLIRALPESIVQAATSRIAPRCPYFTRCGGCHYQHIPYEQQVALKREILCETLRRLSGIDWSEEIPILPSPPWNYRNRIQLQLGPHPVTAGRLQLGFYRASSQALCDIAQCLISSPKLNDLICALNELNATSKLPTSLRQIEAFVTHADSPGWLSLGALTLDFPTDEFAATLRHAWPGVESILFVETHGERRVLVGPGASYYRVGDDPEDSGTRVSHNAFFQVNRYLLPEVVACVTQNLEGKVALDLYAGVGLFTRALAPRFQRVVAVEIDADTVADSVTNVAPWPHVQVHCTDVADFLRGWHEPVDCVLVDPPRAGLAREVVEELLRLRPPALIYLSCDPATLARDLKRLAAGFTLIALKLIDLFPQTFHIETLARLAAHPSKPPDNA